MQILDDTFLEEVGLGALPKELRPEMIKDIYDKLELNVGTRLASQMTEEQLDDFEQIMDKKDDSLSVQWLEKNLPNYRQVVTEELDKLKIEIKRDAAQILSVLTAGETTVNQAA